MNPEFSELDHAEQLLLRAFLRLSGYLPPPGITDSAAVAVAERLSELAGAIEHAMNVARHTARAERDRLAAHDDRRETRTAEERDLADLPNLRCIPAGMIAGPVVRCVATSHIAGPGEPELWLRCWRGRENPYAEPVPGVGDSDSQLGVMLADSEGRPEFVYRDGSRLDREVCHGEAIGGVFVYYPIRHPDGSPATLADLRPVSVHPMRLREEYAGDVFNEPPEITDPLSDLSGTWFLPGEVPIEPDFVRHGSTGLWARTTSTTDPENRLFGYIQKLRGEWCLIVKQSGKLYSVIVRAKPQHRYIALR